eukprot:615124-Alexandrium_andersonii.AAC.1
MFRPPYPGALAAVGPLAGLAQAAEPVHRAVPVRRAVPLGVAGPVATLGELFLDLGEAYMAAAIYAFYRACRLVVLKKHKD